MLTAAGFTSTWDCPSSVKACTVRTMVDASRRASATPRRQEPPTKRSAVVPAKPWRAASAKWALSGVVLSCAAPAMVFSCSGRSVSSSRARLAP